jgi:hypothetical protein
MPRRAANSRVARGFFPVAGVTLLSEASYGLDKPVLRLLTVGRLSQSSWLFESVRLSHGVDAC